MYDSLKYLGVWFDRNSKMRIHMKKTAAKVDKMVNALSRLMTNIKGAIASKRKVLLSVADSIMLYGATIWEDKIRKKA